MTLLATAIFLSVVEPAPPTKVPPKEARYFPTTVGTRWVYDVRSGIEKVQVERVITKVEEKDGAHIVTVVQEYKGETEPVGKFIVSAKGLQQVEYGGKTIADPPDLLLKLPAKPGDIWEPPAGKKVEPREPKLTYTLTAIEEVEVPAGKFRAVRVDSVLEETGHQPYRQTTWYAQDIGMIKWIRGGDEFTQVLRSFTPGKK